LAPDSNPHSNQNSNPDPNCLFRIRIRPNVSDPYGSGSATLTKTFNLPARQIVVLFKSENLSLFTVLCRPPFWLSWNKICISYTDPGDPKSIRIRTRMPNQYESAWIRIRNTEQLLKGQWREMVSVSFHHVSEHDKESKHFLVWFNYLPSYRRICTF